ncbi:hypothetical protein EGI32_17835 [Ferruginibacter sp. HRS2-29]|nr:hypothetical protein [Ferruginibacter sp. HRS2-29]MCP9751508.1 hypothetical protein [Ferruginibacter sp. HRS2-29]MCP9752818.1 hypothetical protein [Ferruginibacter sp. HRS2-29]
MFRRNIASADQNKTGVIRTVGTACENEEILMRCYQAMTMLLSFDVHNKCSVFSEAGTLQYKTRNSRLSPEVS